MYERERERYINKAHHAGNAESYCCTLSSVVSSENLVVMAWPLKTKDGGFVGRGTSGRPYILVEQAVHATRRCRAPERRRRSNRCCSRGAF